MGRDMARAAAVMFAAMAADCSVVVDFSDCARDADCPRGETCNPQRHYCEVSEVERCNGIDDDHDGISDDNENFGVCEPAMRVIGMCRDGVLRCRAGTRLECVRRTSPASAEECNNGLDDDCDGAVDNQATCVQNFPPTANLPIGSDDQRTARATTRPRTTSAWRPSASTSTRCPSRRSRRTSRPSARAALSCALPSRARR